MSRKLHSSALLIAMSIGIVLSGLVVGVALVMAQYSKLVAQSREGRAAYRAALSGTEDGLLRYKYAVSQNKTNSLFNIQNQKIMLDGSSFADSYYRLSFQTASIATVKESEVVNWRKRWSGKNPNSGSILANVDNIVDIDLSYFSKKTPIKTLKVYYTDPFTYSNSGAIKFLPTSYFTALNFQLLNVNDLTANGEAGQRIEEGINTDATHSFADVSKIGNCMNSNDSCHLRIKPLAVKRNAFARATLSRYDGTGDLYPKGKMIYYAIAATDANNNPIEPTDDNPGTIIISSVGTVGQATRRLEAKIDASSGRYLGIFDYGVYCGTECRGL